MNTGCLISAAGLLLLVSTSPVVAAQRFELRDVTATAAAKATPDRRFAVQAVAEMRRSTSAARFSLKSSLADCAPLPDPVFASGFE